MGYYHVTVRHDALGKYRVIRGAERHVVEAAAHVQQRAWNEQYTKKLEVAERRRERDERRRELEDGLREADERTREAQQAIQELRELLAATLSVDDRIDWEALKQHQPFSQPQPQERPYLPIPKEPNPDDAWYRPQLSLIDKFLRSAAEKKQQAADALFQADHAKWRERVASIEETNPYVGSDDNPTLFFPQRLHPVGIIRVREEFVLEVNDLMFGETKTLSPLAIFEARLLSKKNFTPPAIARSQPPLAPPWD